MVATSLILLALDIPAVVYVLPVSLIVCRELAISALREWMASRGIREVVKVGKLGKVKTTLQMVATSLLLFAAPVFSTDLDLCYLFGIPKLFVLLSGLGALYLATIATVLSGSEYFFAALPYLLQSNEENQNAPSISTTTEQNDSQESESSIKSTLETKTSEQSSNDHKNS
jgi:CDP-diacylglycerol--glycerol-3-phosphate 3-phosphatidyltransferase